MELAKAETIKAEAMKVVILAQAEANRIRQEAEWKAKREDALTERIQAQTGLQNKLLDSTLHSSSFDSELTLNEGQLTGTVKKLKPKPNDGPPSLGVISG